MSVLADAKKKIGRRCLEELLAQRDPEIYRDLAIAATVIAKGMMMNWLDAKGINHCHDCPSTEQLIRMGANYLCPQHAHAHAAKPLELLKA